MSATPRNQTIEPRAPAWSGNDLNDPHQKPDKAERVRSMFAAIARSYDLNNRLHSLWQDQAWRRSAVRAAAPRPGEHVLDCACGTGDLTLAFARTHAASVTGLDFTAEMLNLARSKTDRAAKRDSTLAQRVRYVQGDAQELPFDNASFDVVSIAFGIRNVQSPERALREFFRVLRRGGRLVVLEFDRPRSAPLRWFNDFYCGWVMPRTATLLSGDTSGAYKYLPRSVGTFMGGEALSALLRQIGFAGVERRALSAGICVRTLARVEAPGDFTGG